MNTQCRNCTRKGDCWIKSTVELKEGHRMTDLDPNEQRIVIKASDGQCDCYEAIE